jgi:hypothetical protein
MFTAFIFACALKAACTVHMIEVDFKTKAQCREAAIEAGTKINKDHLDAGTFVRPAMGICTDQPIKLVSVGEKS